MSKSDENPRESDSLVLKRLAKLFYFLVGLVILTFLISVGLAVI